MLLLLACTDPASTTKTHPADTADTGAPTDTADTTVRTAVYADPPADWEDALDAFDNGVKRGLKGSLATGASYAIWYQGAIIHTGQVGTADPDGETAPDATTLFEIGSDTKKLTALALLQAVDRGDVSLEDPLSAVLPELSLAQDTAWADTVTLRQLLTHQTGLYDYTPWIDEPDDSALATRLDGAFAAGEYTTFPPGIAWSYANPNYAIAGRVVEAVTGRAWADVIAEDILAPLGLEDTVAREADAVARGNVAIGTGYWMEGTDWPFDPFLSGVDWQYGRVALEDHPDPAFVRPAGCVWSTAEDQARLLGFFVDGAPDVISDAVLAEATTAQVQLYPGWDHASYGMGFNVWGGLTDAEDNFYPVPVLWHGGNTLSYTSASYVLPDRRLAISILSNGYGDYFDGAAADLMLAVSESDMSGTYSAIRPAPLAPEEYAGTYLDEHVLGRITLTADGDTLTMSAPDLDAAGIDYSPTVTPALETVLQAEVAGIPIVWEVARDGDETWLVDRSFVAHSVAELERPHPVTPAARGLLRAPRTW